MATTMPCIGEVELISKSFTMNQHLFNIFTGTSTGLLKGSSMCDKNFANLNSMDSCSSKGKEITCMCWWDSKERNLLTGLRNGQVLNYWLEVGVITNIPKSVPAEKSILRSIKAVDKKILISAFNTGKLNCEHFNFDSTSSTSCVKQLNAEIEINSGQDLFCMDHNLSFQNQVATGGKENPLKVWDINSPTNPIFTAKNVPNDWLNLRVPVWVMKTQFLHNSDKLVTGTGFSQIRLYDPAAQRRPVIDIQIKDSKYPITALALRPSSDFQLIVGTTIGNLSLYDLRKKDLVQNYKGFAGGITDVKFHAIHPYFAACGVDRYVRCYEVDAHKKEMHSLFLKSELNCLLLSSSWSLDDQGHSIEKYTQSDLLSDTNLVEDKKETLNEDNNDESVWDQMEVIKTKKRRKQLTLPSKSKVKKNSK
ncbi:WD repeat-containing protein 74-like [Biomphalaria glabrata]|uniref:WD repeat-containing protein 74-like n=1 Tax=Biomphalaria glabrata TaxID=6526 RepID=A0A9U8EIW6_BIOGL|nr:WD repeat-containing protein 74-like [Biomphalaria glabrata]